VAPVPFTRRRRVSMASASQAFLIRSRNHPSVVHLARHDSSAELGVPRKVGTPPTL
jgi:hypothetical protein